MKLQSKCLVGDRSRIPQDQDHRVSSQEHFTDEAILVHGLDFLLAFAGSRDLRPHFFHVFQDHVAMTIEGFHSTEKLLVVAAIDENLRVVLDGLREYAERASVEFFLLQFLQFFRC